MLFDYLGDFTHSESRNARPWLNRLQIGFGSRNPGPQEGVNANPDDLDHCLTLHNGEIVSVCGGEFEAGEILRELVGRVVF